MFQSNLIRFVLLRIRVLRFSLFSNCLLSTKLILMSLIRKNYSLSTSFLRLNDIRNNLDLRIRLSHLGLQQYCLLFLNTILNLSLSKTKIFCDYRVIARAYKA